MTPREVEELTSGEYAAFWRYAQDDARQQAREARKAARH